MVHSFASEWGGGGLSSCILPFKVQVELTAVMPPRTGPPNTYLRSAQLCIQPTAQRFSWNTCILDLRVPAEGKRRHRVKSTSDQKIRGPGHHVVSVEVVQHLLRASAVSRSPKLSHTAPRPDLRHGRRRHKAKCPFLGKPCCAHSVERAGSRSDSAPSNHSPQCVRGFSLGPPLFPLSSPPLQL